MGLNSNNNYLSALINAGADAQSNLYLVDVIFNSNSPNSNSSAANAANLSVRCKGFNPPAVSQEEYNVKFITANIDRPAAKVRVDRQFSLEFRVDANYNAYKALLEQQGVTFNASHCFVATDIKQIADEGKLFNVNVKALTNGVTNESETPDTEGEVMFRYENCWITEIEPLKFDATNSRPIEVRMTCKYLQGYDLATGV